MKVYIDDDENIIDFIEFMYPNVDVSTYEMTVILNELEFFEEEMQFDELMDILEDCTIYRIGVEEKKTFSDFRRDYQNYMPLELYAKENYTTPEEVLEYDEDGYLVAICDSINSDGYNRWTIYNDNFIAVINY